MSTEPVSIEPVTIREHETCPVTAVLRRLGDRWSPVTTIKQVAVGKLMKGGGMNGAIAENAAYLTTDREGKLWVGRQYAYRVQRLSSTGRILSEITVDGGAVQEKKAGTGVEIKLHAADANPTEATRSPRQEKGTFHAFTAEQVVLDLAIGSDGRLYLLIRLPNGGAALDRFDPGRAVLERVTLRLPASGTFTMAAGRDALYIAAFDGKDGRWKLSWGALEQAQWKPVDSAEIAGSAVAQSP